MNCAQPCCLEWLSHIGGRVRERAATAHNAHLSEHFLLQTHSLCTMHTMSICLNISLWQNIHFALCKKKLCKGIHYAHYTQTTVYLHSRFYTSHFSNVQQCAMSEHDECETHEGNDNSVLRLRHEGQFQISSTARFISPPLLVTLHCGRWAGSSCLAQVVICVFQQPAYFRSKGAHVLAACYSRMMDEWSSCSRVAER